MGKLQTLPSRLSSPAQRLKQQTVAETQRTTGRALQARRLRLWESSPHCATCGRLVAYPHGFDMDHITPLFKGGPDTDENCQLLCNGPSGCHEAKTRDDLRS